MVSCRFSMIFHCTCRLYRPVVNQPVLANAAVPLCVHSPPLTQRLTLRKRMEKWWDGNGPCIFQYLPSREYDRHRGKYQKDLLLGKPQVSMIFCLLSLQWDDESDSNWAIFFRYFWDRLIATKQSDSQIARSLPFSTVLMTGVSYHYSIHI